jgi:hypothetical protein
MIQMPRRSVTRFFIPLIDVLTLLFCIFLLMPLVKGAPDQPGDTAPGSPEREIERLEQELARLRQARGESAEKLREEAERLRQERTQLLQERLAVRVLEVNPDTGKLYYNDPEPTEVRTEADARELIDRDRRATAGGDRELYYLFLYPRERFNPYPTQEQRERYDRWFKDVAHGRDAPGAVPGAGGGKS